MEKSILVAGCSQFEREYLKNGSYHISKEVYLDRLYKNYNVDNLSKKNLTINQACMLVQAFLKTRTYSACILCLGEGDSLFAIPIKDFRRELIGLVELLLDYGVTPVLQNTAVADGYQRVIHEIRVQYQLSSRL